MAGVGVGDYVRRTEQEGNGLVSRLLATWILDAVEQWASGYEVLRETGIAAGFGRYDALLVPVGQAAHCMRNLDGQFFTRPRLCAIEVKTGRSDFLRGLREGQFERYAEILAGLYVATFMGTCKTSELPEGVGHLVVRQQRRRGIHHRAVCKRHPKYRNVTLSADVPWRLIFALHKQYVRETWEERRTTEKALKTMGEIASGEVFGALRKIKERAENAAEQNKGDSK